MPDLEILKTQFKDHCLSNQKEMANIATSIKNLTRKMETIKNKHLEHLRKDFESVRNELTRLKSDMSWVKAIGSVLIVETLGVLIKLIFA